MATAAQQRLRRIGIERYLDEIGGNPQVGHMKTLPEREAGF